MTFENLRAEEQKRNVDFYNLLRQRTLNLLAKFRNARESQDYALRYKLRPRITEVD